MKDSVKKKIEEISKKAREIKESNVNVPLASGNTTSLSKVIKNKEQADLFMKILRSY